MKPSKLTQLLFISILFLALSTSLSSAGQFQVIEEWKHDANIFGNIWHATIDNDGHVVAAFFKTGLLMISPETVSIIAPFGQGKGDIENFMSVFPYKNDIAVVEKPWKLKVFSKINGSYAEKEIVQLNTGKYFFIIDAGLFTHDKWVLAGEGRQNFDPKLLKLYFVKFYNANGDGLVETVKKQMTHPVVYNLMNHYLAADEKSHRVFYIREDQLLLTTLDAQTMNVLKTTNLEIPRAYQEMPEEFYTIEKVRAAGLKLIQVINTWNMSYSSITKMLLHDNDLIIQIRTPAKGPKKFALLFYNKDSLKLEKNIPIDDLLLGAKDGKYYFYADGNPTLDDDTDACTIRIYQWIK